MNTQAVIAIRNLESMKVKTMHILHFILTVVVPLYIIFWVIITLINRHTNQQLEMRIQEIIANAENYTYDE